MTSTIHLIWEKQNLKTKVNILNANFQFYGSRRSIRRYYGRQNNLIDAPASGSPRKTKECQQGLPPDVGSHSARPQSGELP
jgi:hypothetical protein